MLVKKPQGVSEKNIIYFLFRNLHFKNTGKTEPTTFMFHYVDLEWAY